MEKSTRTTLVKNKDPKSISFSSTRLWLNCICDAMQIYNSHSVTADDRLGPTIRIFSQSCLYYIHIFSLQEPNTWWLWISKRELGNIFTICTGHKSRPLYVALAQSPGAGTWHIYVWHSINGCNLHRKKGTQHDRYLSDAHFWRLGAIWATYETNNIDVLKNCDCYASMSKKRKRVIKAVTYNANQ